MTTTDWREFAEQLLRELEDVQREVGDLDVRYFAEDESGKTFELDALKASDSDRWKADQLCEAWEAEKVADDFIDDWRRRLWSAQIQDDRRAAS